MIGAAVANGALLAQACGYASLKLGSHESVAAKVGGNRGPSMDLRVYLVSRAFFSAELVVFKFDCFPSLILNFIKVVSIMIELILI